MKKMAAGPNPVLLLLLAVSLLVLAPWPASCSHPVLFPVAKDPATSLYTIPLRDGHNHVIDLAGPLLWSTCAGDHLPASFKCQDRECKLANAYRPPGCRAAGRHPCSKKTKQCKAYPYNPITGQCAAASLIHTRLIANTTDGRNPVSQASVRAVGACAPSKLLARAGGLPSGATGVAGLAGSGLALPAQVAASQRVANKFLLCLPKRGEGVAIFGGGPFFLPETPQTDVTSSSLAYTPLRSRKGSPRYHLSVKGIAIDQAPVPLPASALDAGGGVVLCTRKPYTLLRPDVYRPFVNAFDKALGREDAKVPAVAPFELCYRSSMLPNTRVGYGVPDIKLVLEGGKDWTFLGSNSMVDVNDNTACLAFSEMKKGANKPGDSMVPSVGYVPKRQS